MGELVLTALLIGVAGFRLWRIIARDTITEPLRAPLIKHSDNRMMAWLLDLILCPWCAGFWITGLLTIAVDLHYRWPGIEPILVWFAASAVCGFLGRADDN